MRETELGDQQVFKKRQRRRASGERRELGAKKVPWRVPGWPGSAGQKGDQVLGTAEGGASRIMEAKLVKNGDSVQLKSDVFMNTMGMFRVMLLDQQCPCLESLRSSTAGV